MSNYSLCLNILTQLIGFKKHDNNDEKITLPDQVEIDALVEFKSFLQRINDKNIKNNFDNVSSSSYEKKMMANDTVDNESFWICNYCTYHNPNNFANCEMCGLPHKDNVCILL